MELDWSALQKSAKSGGVLPDGDYNLVVIEATAVRASTGKPMIKTKMRVIDGPQQDKPVWSQFVLAADSPLALKMFFQNMEAFGLDAAFFTGLPAGEGSMELVAAALRNRGVSATIGTRPWQGQDRNEIKSLRPLQTAGPVPPGVVTGPATVGPVGGPPVPGTPLQAGPPPTAGVPPAPTATSPATPSAPPAQPF